MNSVGCIDISINLVIGRSDANGEIVGRTKIIEKIVGLLLESDGRFGHTHGKKRSSELDIGSDIVQIAHLHDGEVIECSGREGISTLSVALSLIG